MEGIFFDRFEPFLSRRPQQPQKSRLALHARRLSCLGGPHRDRTCDPL